MSDTVIRVENLGKKYTIGHKQEGERYTALRDVIANGAKSIAGRFRGGENKAQALASEDFWALKDVSFEIKQGDRVGIIGRNGAGKSTLLKILSRITEPTEGRISIKGRVASLLEVGTGFHPELTGRENIYLNGAILGMSKIEIHRKFDEIVAFAEVEKFLDTPVKRYSSGMYVRLAFSVAAHLEPEVLIVDEVLAVGDAAFQKKCLGKMESVAENEGRTIFFVSHNMSAIQSLCSRCIFLREGKVKYNGSVDGALQMYLSDSIDGKTFERSVGTTKLPFMQSGAITTFEKDGRKYQKISLKLHSNQAQKLSVDLKLSDATGSPIGFGSLGALNPIEMVEVEPSINNVVILLPIDKLASGNYLISLDLTDPKVKYYDRIENCFSFDVLREPKDPYGQSLQQSWGLGSFELDLLKSEDLPPKLQPLKR